jgi:streptomycin 6-kinase
MRITVPKRFAKDTITREGEIGKKWIEELPVRIESICHQWQLIVDGPVMSGYTGLAIPVRRKNEAYILKVYWRDMDTDTAPLALKIWNGRGAVKVKAHEPELGAVLLEKLDPKKSLEGIEIGKAIIIAGQLLRRLAIPAPSTMRSLRNMSADMIAAMQQRWDQYDYPFPRRLLAEACEWADQLGSKSQYLMTDYDLHYTDILAGKREPWLMIDPKAIAGDPEFGLAQLMWSRLEEIELSKGIEYHFRALVDAADLNYCMARKWTIVRCVDYWLWGLTVGLTNDPVRCSKIITCLRQI